MSQRVRIVAEHRGAYRAADDAGRVAWVELPGVTYHRAADKRDLPTVGDWIQADRWDEAVSGNGAGVVREVLPRTTFLVRKAAGEATEPQPIAANVDVGFVLTSANADFSPARLDRYLTLLRDGGITPVLVLSKIDLVDDPAPLLARLAARGEAVAVSAATGAGLDALRSRCTRGATCILLGSSGVGKSTLLNALIGTAQPTREIREDDRGKHTTTHRELFAGPDGSLWIDTPGMRELAQWLDEGAPEDDHEDAFDDIAELAQGCRFRDCRHLDEPGCAVRATVAPERLASFHKLAHERVTAAERQAKAQKLAAHRKARQRAPKPRDE